MCEIANKSDTDDWELFLFVHFLFNFILYLSIIFLKLFSESDNNNKFYYGNILEIDPIYCTIVEYFVATLVRYKYYR